MTVLMRTRKPGQSSARKALTVVCLVGLLAVLTCFAGCTTESPSPTESSVSSVSAQVSESKGSNSSASLASSAPSKSASSASKSAKAKSKSAASASSESASAASAEAESKASAEAEKVEEAASEASEASESAAEKPKAAKAKEKAPAATQKKQNAEPKQEAPKAEAAPKTESKPVEREKKWVEPVYKTVDHPEKGHYETKVTQVKKVRCNCGEIFDTRDAWKAHQDAFIAEMRKTDPDYVCTGTHMSTYITVDETEEVYVVDQEAYSEQVLVKEGHWE